jgi:tetratricopeptide (TPR) repeat protein
MKKLEPPDLHYVNAAQGWIELGDLEEARREFERLPPGQRAHPDALEVQWNLRAAGREWEEALAVAERLAAAAPNRCSGWIQRSYSLHELKRTAEAWLKLLPAARQFPKESTIPYNLACYACQLHRLDDARKWLTQALQLGDRQQVMAMALKDPDLRPLWPEIK